MNDFHKLEDWSTIDKVFKDCGLSPSWVHVLEIGLTKLYDNNTKVLNYHIENDVCIINSGSIENATFPKSMLKDIKTLINEYKSCIISSKVESIDNYLTRKGFRYNTEYESYIRSITWD